MNIVKIVKKNYTVTGKCLSVEMKQAGYKIYLEFFMQFLELYEKHK
jgi:hypothetical protein